MDAPLTRELWKLPLPTGSVIQEPHLERLEDRVAVLGWVYQASNQPRQFVHQMLLFWGVRAARWTRESGCALEMVLGANGSLVDVGETEWLSEVKRNILNYARNSPPELRHLRNFVDGSGCFEFLCESFEASETSMQATASGL